MIKSTNRTKVNERVRMKEIKNKIANNIFYISKKSPKNIQKKKKKKKLLKIMN